MKTLYALVFVCLSLPAFADVLDITPLGADEDYTAATSGLAPQPTEDRSVGADVDFYVDEYNVGYGITPTELQASSRDDDSMIEDNVYTAGANAPAAPTIEDTPVNPGLDVSVDDEVQEYKLPTTIGEPAIEFSDWG